MVQPDADAPLPDPDVDRLWENCLESCKRPGVERVSRECVRELVAEWSAALERGGEPLHYAACAHVT